MSTSVDDPGAAVDRLRRLVSIESPSGHEPGIVGCLDLLRDWGEPLLGNRGEIVVEDGVSHLLWRPAGRAKVLLLGHVDTVWPVGTLEERPFELDGSRATGPGAFDMKAGLVIALEALGQLEDTSEVAVLVTSDEEVGSITSRSLIERVAGDCDAVLILEPGVGESVKTARKGVGLYRIDITGRASHAGLEPELGANALVELAHLVLEVDALGSSARGTTVTPTVASAGTVTNAVPAAATLHVDARAWEADELDRVDAAIAALRDHGTGTTVQVTGGINRHPMETTQSRGLLEVAREVAASRGLGPIGEAQVGGGSDGNFTAALGIATLDGLGAVGGGAHAVHEWVDVTSLAARATLVAGIIDRLPRAHERAGGDVSST